MMKSVEEYFCYVQYTIIFFMSNENISVSE